MSLLSGGFGPAPFPPRGERFGEPQVLGVVRSGSEMRCPFAADPVGQRATLYLHGARDGCIGVDPVRGAERLLAPSSRMIVIDDAGHFLHLEEPGQVNDHILSWVT
jgi:pimeloyl-ACP methyl ester carboxylesterase